MALFPFYGWIIFCCIYAPHLLYPFICWWAFRLFLCLGLLDNHHFKTSFSSRKTRVKRHLWPVPGLLSKRLRNLTFASTSRVGLYFRIGLTLIKIIKSSIESQDAKLLIYNEKCKLSKTMMLRFTYPKALSLYRQKKHITIRSQLKEHIIKTKRIRCMSQKSIPLFGFEMHSACLWRRQWQPTPVLLPGKSHGRRSLVGWSLWGLEELDTTERLHFHFSLSCIGEGNGIPLQYSCLENPRDGGAW